VLVYLLLARKNLVPSKNTGIWAFTLNHSLAVNNFALKVGGKYENFMLARARRQSTHPLRAPVEQFLSFCLLLTNDLKKCVLILGFNAILIIVA